MKMVILCSLLCLLSCNKAEKGRIPTSSKTCLEFFQLLTVQHKSIVDIFSGYDDSHYFALTSSIYTENDDILNFYSKFMSRYGEERLALFGNALDSFSVIVKKSDGSLSGFKEGHQFKAISALAKNFKNEFIIERDIPRYLSILKESGLPQKEIDGFKIQIHFYNLYNQKNNFSYETFSSFYNDKQKKHVLNRPRTTLYHGGNKGNISINAHLIDIDEQKWVIKSNSDGPAKSEVAAYRLSRFLELDLVPTTISTTVVTPARLKYFSLQKYIPSEKYPENYIPDELLFFEYLLGTSDRHLGNMIYSKTQRHFFIDNEMSFSRRAIDLSKHLHDGFINGEKAFPFARANDKIAIKDFLRPLRANPELVIKLRTTSDVTWKKIFSHFDDETIQYFILRKDILLSLL